MKIVSLSYQRKWFLDWTLISFLIFSSIVLAFSFYHQYIGKIEPCTLCKWERFVYFLVLIISPLGFIQRFNFAVKIALDFIFFLGLCLAIYHVAVQFGLLTDRCEIRQKIENLDDFMQMLDQPKISCAVIGWKLFGLSASIYNAIFSSIALIFLYCKHQPKMGE